MDIPLDDPEANKAAAKIQASFRGHMTRKKMKEDKPREEVKALAELVCQNAGNFPRINRILWKPWEFWESYQNFVTLIRIRNKNCNFHQC